MLKPGPFAHLFGRNTPHSDRSTLQANKTLLVFMVLFFLLYITYKPYQNPPHVLQTPGEYLFYLYYFVVQQSLGIVHEAGHGVCYVLACPKLVMIAMGTLFELAFPLGIALYSRRQGSRSIYYLMMFMLGMSLDHTAFYMATAHEGPVVPAHKSFLGVDGYHDFYALFEAAGVLAYEGMISGIVRAIAYGAMVYSIVEMFVHAFGQSETTS